MKPTYYIVFTLLLFSCNSKRGTEKKEEPNNKEVVNYSTKTDTTTKIIENKIEVIVKDSIHDELARYLSGQKQLYKNEFSELENELQWIKHSEFINSQWEKMEANRQNKLVSWQKEVLAPVINNELPLFYPFSGPDFLHAYSFYPKARSYTLIALEPVKEIKKPTILKKSERNTFLKGTESALRDVMEKSYFITTHMMQDMRGQKAKGVLTLFYIFLSKTNHEILSVTPIDVDDNGNIILKKNLSMKEAVAIQISFRNKENKIVKTLNYFQRDISDVALDKDLDFKKFIQNQPKSNSFLKAASYLMHRTKFNYIRESILSCAEHIFQDDTGIPLRFLDQTIYEIELFGEYTKPIKNFSERMEQEDLRALYNKTPKEKIRHLPFLLGYHFVGDKIQNHQMIIRR